MTKLQQKKTLQIVRQRPWVMMALRCYFNWQQPSKEQTRKHIENKSLGNQLKMARDQKTDENPYSLKEKTLPSWRLYFPPPHLLLPQKCF